MVKITVMLIICVTLAYFSEKQTNAIRREGYHYSVWSDPAYLALAVVLVLFAGLRTNYNDTWNYMHSFKINEGLDAFFSEAENLNIFKNPLFGFCNSLLREFTDDAQILVFLFSLFTQVCFLHFFKLYSHSFTFSIFLYFTLGTFSVTLAAMKQVAAMAILTLAFPFLERKQWTRYFIIVFIAMLMHTYALAFAVLPFFNRRPWKAFTFMFVFATVLIMMNFEQTITAFMDQAEEVGKFLNEAEVFDSHTVNLLRVAVYAVTPAISYLFQKWVFRNSSSADHIVVHMSIISFAFMVMGTQSGANMFGRMAHYFELGMICCLPWMLKQTFNERSCRLTSGITAVCFLGFFVYANAINMSFDSAYEAIGLLEFLG